MPSMPKVITVTGLSSTTGFDVFVPDYMNMTAPMNIGIGVVSTGNTYSIEQTFTNIGPGSTITATGAVWFASSFSSAQTGNVFGSFTLPVNGIRINVTAGTSTGTVVATLISGG
jgi:hypothetical protein